MLYGRWRGKKNHINDYNTVSIMQRRNSFSLIDWLSLIFPLFSMLSLVIAFIGLLMPGVSTETSIATIASGNVGMVINTNFYFILKPNDEAAKKLLQVGSFLVLVYSGVALFKAFNIYGLNSTDTLYLQLNPFILVNLLPFTISGFNVLKYIVCSARTTEEITDEEYGLNQSNVMIPAVVPEQIFSHPISRQMGATLQLQSSRKDNYAEIKNSNAKTALTSNSDIEYNYNTDVISSMLM